MNFKRITYKGKKPYRDRVTGYVWTPGETKLISEQVAKPLLKFVEFEPAKVEPEAAATGEQTASNTTTPTPTEEELALLEQADIDRKIDDENSERDAMLTTVRVMNKASLVEYGKKYDHTFDAKAKVDDMRDTVTGLIHQFGVR